jgi:hypothetical protein
MTVTVKILRNERQRPADKLADAELHFSGEPLDGLKLIGFAIWRRHEGRGYSVTFPARPFNVNGDKANFALLRAIDDPKAQNQVRELVIRAYTEHEQHPAEIAS